MTEINAHRMVARLCEEMAQEVYEELAKKNLFYAMWPRRADFIRHCAPTLREQARRTLAELIAHKDTSEADKERIYEALLLDKTIPQTGVWSVPPPIDIHPDSPIARDGFNPLNNADVPLDLLGKPRS